MWFKFLRFAGLLLLVVSAFFMMKVFGSEVPADREHALVWMALASLLGFIAFSLSFTEVVEDPEYMK